MGTSAYPNGNFSSSYSNIVYSNDVICQPFYERKKEEEAEDKKVLMDLEGEGHLVEISVKAIESVIICLSE